MRRKEEGVLFKGTEVENVIIKIAEAKSVCC